MKISSSNNTISSNNNCLEMATKRLFTLVFIKKPNQVLLGLKTRGFGENLWNGFGGKIEANETPKICAARELTEECGLISDNLKQIGLVKYDVYHRNEIHVVHVFTCSKFKGNEAPSEEMNPVKWFNFNDIPFNKMWPDAKDWYSMMLGEKYFSAHVIYGLEGKITDTFVKEHNELNDALKLEVMP